MVGSLYCSSYQWECLFVDVYECFTCMIMYVSCVCLVPQARGRASGPLEIAVKMVVIDHVGTGIKPGFRQGW